ncbi:ubiquinol-cytochrome c reductase iron-sulfur subunit [Dyadobacter subterraneus]|uniref:Rieske (2Fe-2S) protein n=1 Tax=Dyadobacter subterraneus TaxID=2773304 RepID=A0ABR9WL70_9BACT|nr:Rieske (2Fe-2S) protein [Dyadobacter subterraneus]MBE9466259.1 Rieske (2Fe-2S) protein [Dyadobacter subterraneus]
MNTTQKETMKRGEFLRSLSLGTSTLMAFYCMGTMTSCSTGDMDPLTATTPTTPTTPTDPTTGAAFTGNATTSAGAINFTIDLTNTAYSKLKTSGSYLIIGDLIVALSTTNTYVALSKVCTHEGTTVQYRSSENDIYCANHGSEFKLTGAVDKGPAVAALKAYKAVLSTDGNSLTVTA